MSKIRIKSSNQSGGITAQNVSFSDSSSQINKPPNKKHKPYRTVITVILLLAAITTILAYFNIFPFN